ncbi:retrovirus-related pol polyprotein from transposon TNT 1-94 [Tanacetum coccineum]|uniref:Retrovirus-related pol polyprotein from transposon TNT 1-94 n=1 Tax=Tanacetum coccineum TaxID=301880 RepID=A0ABQ5DWY3_9ASTR
MAGKRYKARLVVKGFQQIHRVDYNEIFSPVVKMTTIRLVLNIVAFEDFHLEQLDVKTTFLHGDLDEDIYMTQPRDFQSAGKEENLVGQGTRDVLWTIALTWQNSTSLSGSFPLVFEMKDKCNEKRVLDYVLTVGVTTVEWESRLQKSITIYTKISIHLVKYLKVFSWAKLVQILISEGSLSLLKILGTKSLAEMFIKLVMKEKLKFCTASTGLRVN